MEIMKRFGIAAALCVAASIWSGCAMKPAATLPAPALLAERSSASVEALTKGRAYFLRECGACHRRFSPHERTAKEWQTILARKAGKVSLTAGQFQMLSDYIIQASVFANNNP